MANATEAEARRRDAALRRPGSRVFLPAHADTGGIFIHKDGKTSLLARIDSRDIDRLVAEGRLREIERTKKGRHLRPVASGKGTAATRRNASWLAAERIFKTPDGGGRTIRVSLGESPIGLLSRRKDSRGRPFLSPEEVAAGERLRADFERSQLGPAVAQDWRRFLTAGVEGGGRCSAQERDIDEGAAASRARLHAALDAIGPGLADAALRVCCFLEGLETMESAMNWSARSGKIVLKIALQRLAEFYEETSVRKSAKIGVWRATGP